MLIAGAGTAPHVASVDPRWARAIRYAVLLAVIAELARTAIAFIPLSSLGFGRGTSHGIGWYAYFSLVCVWWVVQWYAALKLTRTDPMSSKPISERVVLWGLRVVATSFMVFPFAIHLLIDEPGPRGLPTLHVLVRACAMVVAILFFLRVRDVCRRLGGVAPGGQAALLALLLPVAMWSSRTWSVWRGSTDPLASFVGLPSYQFGDTAWLRRFVQSFPSDVGGAMEAGPKIAIAAACWVVMFRLLILAWRVDGRAVGDSVR